MIDAIHANDHVIPIIRGHRGAKSFGASADSLLVIFWNKQEVSIYWKQ